MGDWLIAIGVGSLVAGIAFFALSKLRLFQDRHRSFQNTQIPDTRVNREPVSALYGFNKLGRNIKVLPAILVLICIGWIGWPYYALYDLATAFRDGDSARLENRVAWDSVRQGLRGDLNAILLQRVGKDSSGGSGLAAILGPAIINQMIEGYVTPQGVASLVRPGNAASTSERSDASGQVRHLDLSRLKYAFFSGGPLTFKVEIENEKNDGSPFVWILKWNGNWRLTRLILPAGTFADRINAKPAGSAQGTTTTTKRESPAAIKVALLNKGFKNSNPQNSDFEDDITFRLSFENLTDKDIRAFDGILTFTDLLDNVIHSSKLAINEIVRTRSTLTWNGQINTTSLLIHISVCAMRSSPI